DPVLRAPHHLASAQQVVLPRAFVRWHGSVDAGADRRAAGPAAARADRGRADPGRPGRVDLAARQRHSPGLDVSDSVPLRVPHPEAAPAVRRDPESSGLLDSEPARSQGERPALPPARPALTLVSPVVHLDPRRSDRARAGAAAGHGRPAGGPARVPVRGRVQRAGTVCGPPLRVAGRAGVRVLRRVRPRGKTMTSRLRWLPAVVGVAYVVTVAAVGPDLVHDLNWNTDISGPLALAERLRGDGAVSIPHFGTWTTYWFLLATRSLPGHQDLWEALGYAFTVMAALLLGWATARVAGRWAGVTAGAAALLVSPFALRPLMTLFYHVTNPFTAAVLGAYLVLLPRRRSFVLAVGVGLLAGANAASDPLLWVAGIAPFALAAGLLARLLRSRAIAVR